MEQAVGACNTLAGVVIIFIDRHSLVYFGSGVSRKILQKKKKREEPLMTVIIFLGVSTRHEDCNSFINLNTLLSLQHICRRHHLFCLSQFAFRFVGTSRNIVDRKKERERRIAYDVHTLSWRKAHNTKIAFINLTNTLLNLRLQRLCADRHDLYRLSPNSCKEKKGLAPLASLA